MANTLIFVIMEVNGLAKISTFFMLVIRFGIVLVTWKFSLRLNESQDVYSFAWKFWLLGIVLLESQDVYVEQNSKNCIYINY